jgi:hypothetical protein
VGSGAGKRALQPRHCRRDHHHAAELDDQVKEVVRNLTADGSTAMVDGEIGEDEIAAFISDVTDHDAGPENVKRVAAKLAAAGWPLAGVDDAAV